MALTAEGCVREGIGLGFGDLKESGRRDSRDVIWTVSSAEARVKKIWLLSDYFHSK